MVNKKDWQEMVWDAKERIYQETKDMDFENYWKYVEKGAETFLSKYQLKKELLTDGNYRIVCPVP